MHLFTSPAGTGWLRLMFSELQRSVGLMGVFQIHALYSPLGKRVGFRATALGSVTAQHVPSLLLKDGLASGMDSA